MDEAVDRRDYHRIVRKDLFLRADELVSGDGQAADVVAPSDALAEARPVGAALVVVPAFTHVESHLLVVDKVCAATSRRRSVYFFPWPSAFSARRNWSSLLECGRIVGRSRWSSSRHAALPESGADGVMFAPWLVIIEEATECLPR